jgi:hypothetical protein
MTVQLGTVIKWDRKRESCYGALTPDKRITGILRIPSPIVSWVRVGCIVRTLANAYSYPIAWLEDALFTN